MPKVEPGDYWKHVNFYYEGPMLQERVRELRENGEKTNFSALVRKIVAEYLGCEPPDVNQGKRRSGMQE